MLARVILLSLAFAALLYATGIAGHDHGRQAEVARKGAEVMPFDLERTTHRFEKRPWGGVQTVVADEPDAEQVALVRGHLREEAGRFARGDFDDPMAIHGMEMPGLAELRAAAADGQVTIAYAEVPEGARLTYRTRGPGLVRTVHAWFDAQVMDHGAHAEAGEG